MWFKFFVIELASPALIVIDLQRYFLEENGSAYFSGAKKIMLNVHKLIEAFRTKKLPIVFTRHAHKKNEDAGSMNWWWGENLPWETDIESEIAPELKPGKDEFIITKSRYSAFFKTELEQWCHKKNIQEIILCGVMTNVCIETTARDGFMRDFHPIVVGDACAAKSKKYHDASLLNLSYAFCEIVDTRELINKVTKL